MCQQGNTSERPTRNRLPVTQKVGRTLQPPIGLSLEERVPKAIRVLLQLGSFPDRVTLVAFSGFSNVNTN